MQWIAVFLILVDDTGLEKGVAKAGSFLFSIGSQGYTMQDNPRKLFLPPVYLAHPVGKRHQGDDIFPRRFTADSFYRKSFV